MACDQWRYFNGENILTVLCYLLCHWQMYMYLTATLAGPPDYLTAEWNKCTHTVKYYVSQCYLLTSILAIPFNHLVPEFLGKRLVDFCYVEFVYIHLLQDSACWPQTDTNCSPLSASTQETIFQCKTMPTLEFHSFKLAEPIILRRFSMSVNHYMLIQIPRSLNSAKTLILTLVHIPISGYREAIQMLPGE